MTSKYTLLLRLRREVNDGLLPIGLRLLLRHAADRIAELEREISKASLVPDLKETNYTLALEAAQRIEELEATVAQQANPGLFI